MLSCVFSRKTKYVKLIYINGKNRNQWHQCHINFFDDHFCDEATPGYVEWLHFKRLNKEVTYAGDCEVKEVSPGSWSILDKCGEVDETVMIVNGGESTGVVKEMLQWEAEMKALGSIDPTINRMKKTVFTRLKNEARKLKIDNEEFKDSLANPTKLMEELVPTLKVVDNKLVDPHLEHSFAGHSGLMTPVAVSKGARASAGLVEVGMLSTPTDRVSSLWRMGWP